MKNTIAIVTAAAAVALACSASAEDVTFSRDIRPLLAENCFGCHGPDEAAREAELRLDVRDSACAPRNGSPAIVPGDAGASGVIERVTAKDLDLRMPPADSGKRLTSEQIEHLGRWIDSGAPYERHWAFEPVRQPGVPEVARSDRAINPIDHFVLARLQQQELSPSPPADRFTLIRRLYLDLLGVLPSIADVDAFAGDDRPGAYERLVDRVLASLRFGERWGRHWLDQARYADSHGYTNDNERVMWPYRDWVVGAINRDLPFDEFTIEQLAGDLLPHASIEQTIATGFHRNTLINTEGGTKADQFRDEQVKDRVDTTGGVWLGLTVGCAQCHSHKYDPVSQKEYYQLYAFFNSTADNNSVPPTVPALTVEQQARLQELDARQAELQAELTGDPERSARQSAWERALLQDGGGPPAEEQAEASSTAWTVLEIDGLSIAGAAFDALDDHSLLVSGNNPAGELYLVSARSPLPAVRSVRLEVLTHNELPGGGPGRADDGNFVLSEFWFRTGDGRELRFSRAQADQAQPNYDVAGAIDGDNLTGWSVGGSPGDGPNHDGTAWFVLPTTLELGDDRDLTFNLQHDQGPPSANIGRLRVSISAEEWIDRPSYQELRKLVAIPADERGPAQRKRIGEAFLRGDAALAAVVAELQTIGKARDELQSRAASTMVMRELDEPRLSHVQQRGDFLQPSELVQPDVPSALPALSPSEKSPSRLDLARWLVTGDNPLTSRVQVNRVWMRLFGRGLVETENDFGAQGALPSHPELLDWLAAEYVRRGWSTKHLLRLIVTSATYRQQSRLGGRGTAVDPQNRLLWRQNRVRVEGEIVRDLALSAGGMLSDKIGGPSVYPPQPEGVYAFTQREMVWRTSPGEDRLRRGMYTFFYRSAPYPMLTTFDAPKFNQTCTRRDRSNTPLQSLTVANDPTMFEAARALAGRILSEGDPDATSAERIALLVRTCLVRPPAETEARLLEQYFQQQHRHFRSHPPAAIEAAPVGRPEAISTAQAAAYTATARVVLNLDEFITRE